jgi:hypothetical protein
VNNSQSIERIKRYYKVIAGRELSADQRRAAQLADGLVSPKTTFHRDIREIVPEFAGYGVLPCPHVREVVQTARGIDQGRPFPTSTMEREQPSLAADRMQIESISTPPAKDSTCERGSGQGRVGSRQTGHVACPSFPPPDPVPVRKCARGPEQEGRALRSASPDARDRARPQPRSIYRVPPHCGRRPSEQPTEPGFEVGWTTRRT